VGDLTDWLAGTAPPLLVTGTGGAVLWDPDAPAHVAPVRDAVDEADGYTYLHATPAAGGVQSPRAGHGSPARAAAALRARDGGCAHGHEWAHVADAAGWVPRTMPSGEYATLRSALAGALDAAIAAAPAAVRRATPPI
jgi:hypothetical protein